MLKSPVLPHQKSAGPQATQHTSLTRQTILRIAIIIIGVTLITSILTYFYLFSRLENQYQSQLEKYITERGEREHYIFTLTQDNQNLMKGLLTQKLFWH